MYLQFTFYLKRMRLSLVSFCLCLSHVFINSVNLQVVTIIVTVMPAGSMYPLLNSKGSCVICYPGNNHDKTIGDSDAV